MRMFGREGPALGSFFCKSFLCGGWIETDEKPREIPQNHTSVSSAAKCTFRDCPTDRTTRNFEAPILPIEHNERLPDIRQYSTVGHGCSKVMKRLLLSIFHCLFLLICLLLNLPFCKLHIVWRSRRASVPAGCFLPQIFQSERKDQNCQSLEHKSKNATFHSALEVNCLRRLALLRVISVRAKLDWATQDASNQTFSNDSDEKSAESQILLASKTSTTGFAVLV